MRDTCARCDFVGDADSPLADHATSSGHWLCGSCGRSLADTDPRMSCESCLTAARSNLAGILVMWQELPAHLRTVAGSALGGTRGGSDGHPLPGGSVLALLGPGSPGVAARRLTKTDVARGLDGREHGVDNLAEDAPSVAWSLATWEDDWRHTRGDDPAMTGSSVSRVVQSAAHYLDVHARWAANNHGAFDEFADDLRKLHSRLEVATHRLRRPTKLGADCFDCGGDLIRRVTDEGLEEEHATCVVCKQQYEPGRYTLALKAAAEASARVTFDGIPYATPAALASDLGRSEHTIRSWAQRGHVRSEVRSGVLFVNTADVTERHEPKGQTA
jgi:hypothetical protein